MSKTDTSSGTVDRTGMPTCYELAMETVDGYVQFNRRYGTCPELSDKEYIAAIVHHHDIMSCRLHDYAAEQLREMPWCVEMLEQREERMEAACV